MAQSDLDDGAVDSAVDTGSSLRRWARRIGWVLVAALVGLAAFAAFLSTPIGKRFIADQIAALEPQSGLRFEVGRIEGSVFSSAILRDVQVKDPEGVFLTIPEMDLDWRPFAYLWNGLDIRNLALKRASLDRLPQLEPGDSDAAVLPGFDIRVDRFAIEALTLGEGVTGAPGEQANFEAVIDIRQRHILIDAQGEFGPQDRIEARVDSRPDDAAFAINLDYKAAADGPIAALAGLDAGYEARIAGDGSWQRWLGHAIVVRNPDRDDRDVVAALQLTNRAGRFGVLGKIMPDLAPDTWASRAMGEALALAISGTFEERIFQGEAAAISSAADLRLSGGVDLGANRFDDFAAKVSLAQTDLAGGGLNIDGAQLAARINGAFDDLAIEHELTVAQLISPGAVRMVQLQQTGIARFDGQTLSIPLNAAIAQVETGNDFVDPLLKGGTMTGDLSLSGSQILADPAQIIFPAAKARMKFEGNFETGAYTIAGPVEARGLDVRGLGKVSADSTILTRFGAGDPWMLNADLNGFLGQITSPALVSFAGEQIDFEGGITARQGSPLVMRDVAISSDRFEARLSSEISSENAVLLGSGSHSDYGPFSLDAKMVDGKAEAQVALANPVPQAGVSDVALGLLPSDEGIAIAVSGQSLFGPFDGDLAVSFSQDGPVRLSVDRLLVNRTRARGGFNFDDRGIEGELMLKGGGLDGEAKLFVDEASRQAFALDLGARRLRFEGETPIAIAQGKIDLRGYSDGASTSLDGEVSGSGFEYGELVIANFAGRAQLVDGTGQAVATFTGRRADRFELRMDAQIAPEQIGVIAQGEYGDANIAMPRRAVFTPLEDGGYALSKTQIGFDRGYMILEGQMGGAVTQLDLSLVEMPLRLADVAGAGLGIDGRVSGVVNWSQQDAGLPIGKARVRIDDFTRSGLVLASEPIDVFAVLDLSPKALRGGARLRSAERQIGQFETSISQLPQTGALMARLRSGLLDAGFDYDGDAEALWRLAAIETFDLLGPAQLDAEVTGTLENPRITGNVSSDNLRLQSALAGIDIKAITARGVFEGSQLQLTRFAGQTEGGGSVSGSGIVDLAGISATRGPRIDIRAAADSALLLDANGIEAVLTGPLRMVSDGVDGVIAGRVEVDKASWVLGAAAEDMTLPQIKTIQIETDEFATLGSAGPQSRTQDTSGAQIGSWRYMIDASAPDQVNVEGLGLDSEWAIDIALRGTADDPRIGGEARLVRGDYAFAGTRFELTRGRIAFDEDGPIDPRLDVEAEASANGTDVVIDITGSALTPEIAFSSSPPLPEEEILARLLFGGSITTLSATDALQLTAALAALQGGDGGLDPIGELRRSIGLDQLRIVAADPVIGRGTGVALGKNLGRGFYVELVTDAQGYSATQVEFQITSWLALLGTVSTIGRDSVLAEISRDY
ncbi:MAG: translocation/assembly module TamB domain-containing protein [Erythrobacter sp.]|nr:translocation/assembly module TamB domain-containing protein [Erythrobacter sp.]